jgi:hypothetical protein
MTSGDLPQKLKPLFTDREANKFCGIDKVKPKNTSSNTRNILILKITDHN